MEAFYPGRGSRISSAKEKNLVYIESHVGYPEYALEKPGEWQNGISNCWKRLDVLKEFSYFGILNNMNPSGLMNYPGSAVLVLKATEKVGFGLKADVWDINPEVAASWHDIALPGADKFRFHLGDGFSGVRSLMDSSDPALLLIDPPYLEKETSKEPWTSSKEVHVHAGRFSGGRWPTSMLFRKNIAT